MHAALYRSSLATAMGLSPDRFDEAGVDVIAGADRQGRRLVSHYRVGDRSVIWSDPDLVGALAGWHDRPTAASFDEFRVWAGAQGAKRLGGGYEHVLAGEWDPPARPAAVRLLDGSEPTVLAAGAELARVCGPADVDASDFDLDALDDHLAGWFEGGDLVALAGGRAWEARPGFHDIGVLVRPTDRCRGRGRHVVAAVVDSILAAGHRPLYRCPVEHVGSWRLCRSLGFVAVVELEAFEWPA